MSVCHPHCCISASHFIFVHKMAFSEFILIPVKSISPSVTCWTVKVQVSKLWKTVDHVNGKAIGKLEMILFDSEVGSYYVYM